MPLVCVLIFFVAYTFIFNCAKDTIFEVIIPVVFLCGLIYTGFKRSWRDDDDSDDDGGE